MNSKAAIHSTAGLDAIETRIALRVAARLGEQATQLPNDVSERLRHAREQAVAGARAARSAKTASVDSVAGISRVLVLGRTGREGTGWWARLASVLPLVALLAGLLLIEHRHQANQISVAAEIDLTLLADDLPPDAYRDPGFVEFLKAPWD